MRVAELFLVTTRPSAPWNAAARADDPSKVADFLTMQSFVSLAAVTGAIKGSWQILQKIFGDWADSFWVPLAFCILFGVSQLILSITTDDSKLKGWRNIAPAAFIAITNTLVLFGAVEGVEPAADDAGIT